MHSVLGSLQMTSISSELKRMTFSKRGYLDTNELHSAWSRSCYDKNAENDSTSWTHMSVDIK